MAEDKHTKLVKKKSIEHAIKQELDWLGYHRAMVRKSLRGVLPKTCLYGWSSEKAYKRSHCKSILRRRNRIKQCRTKLLLLG